MSKFDEGVKIMLSTSVAQINTIENYCRKTLIGKTVLVTSKYYNGQVFGRSKKCLTGTHQKIENVFIDSDGVSIILEGHQGGIRPDEVVFLE